MENFNPINKIHQIKKIIIIQPFAFILYIYIVCSISTVSVQFIRSFVSDFVIPWTAARQASLCITNSQSTLKLMSIMSVMPSNHLILCLPLLLPSLFPSISVFSNEPVLCIRWPKYWSFSFNIGPCTRGHKELDTTERLHFH